MKEKWERAKRNTKRFWNRYLRPKVEPALRMFVIRKVSKEVDRHVND